MALDSGEMTVRAHRAWSRALVYRARGEYAEAIACFDRAAFLDPAAAAPRLEIGRMLLAFDRIEQALPHLEASEREGDPRGLLELAYAFRRLGDYPSAIDALLKFTALERQTTASQARHQIQSFVQLHALLLLEGRPDEGMRLFERVSSEQLPVWPFGHEALGDFRLRSGDPEGALQCYRRAGKLGGVSSSLERKTALALSRISAIAAPTGSDPSLDLGLRVPAEAGAVETSGASLRGRRP